MTPSTGFDAGRAAIERAATEVARAAARFDQAAPAFDLLLATTGRVVVTGLGKSGLVGAKLAATLASTGTPSLFVHAADALHGDAGMVVRGDALIAISKSGRTAEVVRFAEMVRRRGVPVIAMSGCGRSSDLAVAADAWVDLHVDCEADEHDLAPTTSTTVTLAIGDALAIALMTAKGFGPAEFHEHHPGGALGQRLST